MVKKTAKQKNSVWRLSFSYVGVVVGALFFALSLTPSLLPRGIMFQGLITGITAVIGYGLGLAVQNTWLYLQLPSPKKHQQDLLNKFFTALVVIVCAVFLWKFVGWQNEVRAINSDQTTITPIVLIPIVLISSFVGYLVLVASRSIKKLFAMMIRWSNKVMPKRLANVIGTAVAAVFLITLVNGVLINGLFGVANSAFSVRDTTTDEGIVQPIAPEKSGSPESDSAWDTLGRQGRKFVSTGPSIADLNAFSGGGAIEPVRVYTGLKAADSEQGLADLALSELQRTGGFDREVLVVVTTTGTGWLDPKAVDPIEYMYNGDTAIVGVQYSYLPSWISLFADQGKAKDTSQTVFSTIHDYWQTLPADSRPEIYIYGLSLGSFGAESILQSINIVNEPIDGAVLTGPPFVNDLRNDLVNNRDEDSPAWQPVIDDGRTVRFTAKENALQQPTAEWGDSKIVYAQHATDPVTFFSPDLAFNEPDWLKSGQRGPDITGSMHWIPLVTFWQVAADLPSAGAVADGHGHNYSRATMIDTWHAVTEPDDWTEDDSVNLKEYFQNQ